MDTPRRRITASMRAAIPARRSRMRAGAARLLLITFAATLAATAAGLAAGHPARQAYGPSRPLAAARDGRGIFSATAAATSLFTTGAPDRPAAGRTPAAPPAQTSAAPRARTPAAPRAQTSATRAQTSATRGRPGSWSYVVRPGDSLSSIAQRFYGQRGNWSGLYRVNRGRIHNPDLIYSGQVITIPAIPPAPWAMNTAAVTADRSGPSALTALSANGGGDAPSTGTGTGAGPGAGAGGPGAGGSGGALGCAGLETLWERAGGSAAAAAAAASIAMAESGGRQYATGAAGERGYWQINPVNGALSTYDPYGNARAAVLMSADGTNWSPWTTYTSGAYAGRC